VGGSCMSLLPGFEADRSGLRGHNNVRNLSRVGDDRGMMGDRAFALSCPWHKHSSCLNGFGEKLLQCFQEGNNDGPGAVLAA
jgi:hypothetical protein